ncbi:hypothetical protein [Streptomyces sp. AM8-1-1]|uniref:hypothetical protein n=1 Tax=Streptomyces sp. AM8-1-1 TaxID=3075825 RepID=UPI0028C3CADC|nr:hypothetical protein [Streptomyces sp. AM8-1-1]WNO70290.1 hypothetical protein RPQ07_01015 [Streptomyces sp. AM8-1-1]
MLVAQRRWRSVNQSAALQPEQDLFHGKDCQPNHRGHGSFLGDVAFDPKTLSRDAQWPLHGS